MAKSLTLILGGARSGKSTFAQKLAEQRGRDVLFVATAEALDDEMAHRIAAHKAERPSHWQTLETPLNVGKSIAMSKGEFEVVLLDCMTLLASNVLLSFKDSEMPERAPLALKIEVEGILTSFRQGKSSWIIVSNEVGLGLVPDNPLGRIYRDVLGTANQKIAECADEVLFMVAGIPLFRHLKSDDKERPE